MVPPKSAVVTETKTSTYWFDEEGILYVIGKNENSPFEERKKQTEEFIRMLNGKKICAIMDITQSPPSTREIREYNLKMLPQIFKCAAFVTSSVLGRMLVNLYLGISPLPFPAKIFATEQEAHAWIRQCKNAKT